MRVDQVRNLVRWSVCGVIVLISGITIDVVLALWMDGEVEGAPQRVFHGMMLGWAILGLMAAIFGLLTKNRIAGSVVAFILSTYVFGAIRGIFVELIESVERTTRLGIEGGIAVLAVGVAIMFFSFVYCYRRLS